MRTLSLRTVLCGIVFLLVVAVIGVGAMAINSLAKTRDNAVQLGTNWLPSVDVVHELRADLNEFRVLNAKHILSTDEDEMRSIEGEMTAKLSEIESDMENYSKLISSPDEALNFERVKTSLSAYLASRAKMTDLSKRNQNTEATALFKGEVARAYAEVVPHLEKALSINRAGAESEVASGEATYARIWWTLISFILAGVALGLAGFWFTNARVVRSILGLSSAMEQLAQRNLSIDVPGTGRGDELGVMASAVQVFRTNMIEADRLREEQAAAQAAREKRQATIEAAIRAFEGVITRVVGTVSSTSGQLEQAAESLTKTAGNTQELSTAVASASEQTSVNVQGVAAASEELAATVSEIARQVQESANITGQAVTQATKTNEQVAQLSDVANRIGDVVNLINTIAGQTNLLALNATIEAARAGDAGKGFAVVAQEVKALAAQTAKATNEIASQIASMQGATNEAVTAIQEIGLTINKVNEISGAIAAAVEEQEATTKEITRNVAEAAKGTSEVADNITDVSNGAIATGSASSQILSSAKQLAGESVSLKRAVDEFLNSIKAA